MPAAFAVSASGLRFQGSYRVGVWDWQFVIYSCSPLLMHAVGSLCVRGFVFVCVEGGEGEGEGCCVYACDSVSVCTRYVDSCNT